MTRCLPCITRSVLSLGLGLPIFGPRLMNAQQPPQQIAMTDRALRPRFLVPAASRGAAPVEIDATRIPVLLRKVSLNAMDVRLDSALDMLARQAGVKLAYVKSSLPVDSLVRFRSDNITVAAALTELLLGSQVDVLVSGPTQMVLVRRTPRPVITGSLVGRVTDTATGRGVPAADVFLDGTRWRTTTDTAGWYRLADVDTGSYTLAARRLGYAKRSRRVTVRENREDTVDVALPPVAARLDELITTATGRQRRLDIANDVTTINADSVMQVAPIRSVTDLLENRVPGLTVQHTSGAPGDPSRLRLRGVSSVLRSNDPIVIVDGVRVYAEQSASRGGNLARRGGTVAGVSGTVDVATSGYASAAPSPLDYIDPNTIETIEVLKGPSAATLYGQDAANGVIVITTKKGRPGPAHWTAAVERGRTQIEGDYPELVYRWGHDIFHGAPLDCTAAATAARECVGDSVLSFQLLNDPALTVLDHGHRTVGSLGVSGGTPTLTYAVTGTYSNEIGLLKLPDYEAARYQSLVGVAPPDWMRQPQALKQWGVNSSLTARLGAKADVSLRAGVTRTAQQKSSLQDQFADLMSTYLDRASGVYYRGGTTSTVVNPLVDYFQRATDAATSFTNSVNLNYRPRGWLTVTADAGLNVDQRTDQLYIPRGPNIVDVVGKSDSLGSVSDAQGRSVVSTLNLRGNALQPLGRGFQFKLAAGINYTGTSTNDVSVGSRDLPPGTSLKGATFDFWDRNETSDATFGWYLEPSVGNSKFNFTSGLRLDGGKNYGDNVSGLSLPKFPKLGFSYLLSDESWFPFKDFVQSLRLRVSYGRASRQPGPEDRLRLYSQPVQIFADSQVVPGVELATLGNTEVRPERSGEFEGGMDADLLDNRLTVSVTGYRKTTDDALLSVPVAPEIAGSGVSIIKNIGVTRNTGLELDVGAQLVRSGPVTWGTRLQLSRRRDMLVKLGPGVEPFYSDPYSTGGGIVGGLRMVSGYPLFGRWSRPILGYADANGNGVLEPQEIQLGDTAVYVGSTLPNYTAGLSTTVSLWHGAVVFDASFAYEDGVAQRNEVALGLAPFSAGQQVPGVPLADQVATVDLTNPDILGGKSDYNWIQTVSTTRFTSLAVRYTLPATAARRVGAETLSIAVQGGNLGLWTNYRGLDPNVNAFGTGNNVTDTGILPQPRTWQVRVNATY